MENDPDISNSSGRSSRAVNICGVGDIMVIARAARALEKNGSEYPFGHVAPLIRSADLAFGNLEMPICSNHHRQPAFPDVCPDFVSPPQIARVLKITGFDVINLANNHMMDWGSSGLEETIVRLREAGLHIVGAGTNLQEARQAAILYRNGLSIACLGYVMKGVWNATSSTPGTAPIDQEMIIEDMQRIRDDVDLVVVSLHMGFLSDYPKPDDRRLARKLVEHGADLILGHGPHVVQGIEIYNDRAIVYSMGNFMIDIGSGNVENKVMLCEHLESIIFDVDIIPHRAPALNITPIVISEDFQTIPADLEREMRIRSRVETLSTNLDRMSGLALWEHAGMLNVTHELDVMIFQTRQFGWRHVFKRIKKIRLYHVRLLIGYLVGKTKHLFRHER